MDHIGAGTVVRTWMPFATSNRTPNEKEVLNVPPLPEGIPNPQKLNK